MNEMHNIYPWYSMEVCTVDPFICSTQAVSLNMNGILYLSKKVLEKDSLKKIMTFLSDIFPLFCALQKNIYYMSKK